MRLLTPFVSLTLIPLLLVAPLPAQTEVSADALQLKLVDSDGNAVPAGSHSKRGFTVEVVDSKGKGVSDAAIAFRLPDSGSTGVFGDGGHATVAYTDSTGRAHVSGIQWSDAPGVVSLRITASKANAHAGILLEETLVLPNRVMANAGASPAAAAPSSIAAATPAQTDKVEPLVSVSTGARGGSKKNMSGQELAKAPQPTTTINSDVAGGKPAGVSVTNATGANKVHSNKTKWIIIVAALAAGGVAAAALTAKGKSTTSSTSASSVGIGSPTVSIGHP